MNNYEYDALADFTEANILQC